MERLTEITLECREIRKSLSGLHTRTPSEGAIIDQTKLLAGLVERMALELRDTRVAIANGRHFSKGTIR